MKMKEEIQKLLVDLKSKKANFKSVISFIETYYECFPTAFKNGQVTNAAEENQGSAKVLSFGQLNNLSKEDTLLLFGEHYDAVMNNPEGQDHQNIRQFQQQGWDGVSFQGEALRLKV